MNGLGNLDETYREYSLACADNRWDFRTSGSQQAVEVAKAFASMMGRRSPSSNCFIHFGRHCIYKNLLLVQLSSLCFL